MEGLNIPVVTSLNGKDTFLSTHPLSAGVVGSYSRASANRTIGEADLVCFVGSKTGGMTTHFWQVPAPGIDAIQIDIEPAEIGRNYPLKKPAVQGDAQAVLSAMAEMMDKKPPVYALLGRRGSGKLPASGKLSTNPCLPLTLCPSDQSACAVT